LSLARIALEDRPPVADFDFAGAQMACDWTGCLYWAQENLLVVSDLHLEKGSSLAARGALVPPWDTGATLARLEAQLAWWRPTAVICLGDSFHDGGASERMPEPFRAQLKRLMAGRDWIWIAGNHDPEPPAGLGGITCDELAVGRIIFRHEPRPLPAGAEISGHLHPVARIARRGRTVSRRCFASDGARMVMPSFGAYTGGLNVRDRAFEGLFDEARFHAHLLGRGRVYTIGGSQLV